jgi:hypothetical protein
MRKVLRKLGMRAWPGLNWLMIGSSGGCLEHSNERLGLKKGG